MNKRIAFFFSSTYIKMDSIPNFEYKSFLNHFYSFLIILIIINRLQLIGLQYIKNFKQKNLR
jgi:hypothetical protein